MLDGQHITDTTVAIARSRIETRGIGEGSFLDLLGGNTRDLGDSVEIVLAHALSEEIPHGADLGLAAILERDLILTIQSGIDGGSESILDIEAGGIGQPTLRNAREQVLLGGNMTCCLGNPSLTFPHIVTSIPPGEAIVQIIPAHETLGLATLDQVALLQECGLEDVGTPRALVHKIATGLDVIAYQERTIRPLLDPQVIDHVAVDDHLAPTEGQSSVGAGAQMLPVIGFLAQVGHTGIDHDVVIGLHGRINSGTAGVIVVGQLGRSTPAHEDARALDGRLPTEGVR